MHAHTHTLCKHSDMDRTRTHTHSLFINTQKWTVCTCTHTHMHTLSVNTQRWISELGALGGHRSGAGGGTYLGSTFPRTAAPASCLSRPSAGRRQTGGVLPCPGPRGPDTPTPPRLPKQQTPTSAQSLRQRPLGQSSPPGLLLPQGGAPFLLWEDGGVSVRLAWGRPPKASRETAMSPAGQARTGWAPQSPLPPGLRAAAGTGRQGCLFLGACWTRGSACRGPGRGVFLQGHRLSLQLTFSSTGPHLGVSGADPGSEPQPTTPSGAVSFPPGGSGPSRAVVNRHR